MDGQDPAPPKKPWNDDSAVNTNTCWFPMVLKWCEMDFGHPQYYFQRSSLGQDVLATSQGPLKDLHFAHLKHGFFHQNKGKPPFTRQCSGV